MSWRPNHPYDQLNFWTVAFLDVQTNYRISTYEDDVNWNFECPCLRLPFKIENKLFNKIHSTNKDNWKQNFMVENRKFTLLCWMLYPIVVITFKVFISWSRRLKKTLRSSVNNELVVFSFWHCLAYALSTSALPRRNDRAFRATVLSVVFFYCYAVSSYTNVFLLLCWMSCELLSL